MSNRKSVGLLPSIALVCSILLVFSELASKAYAGPPLQSGGCPGTPVSPGGTNPYEGKDGRGKGQCTWWAWSKRPDLPWFSNADGYADKWADSAFKCGFLVDSDVLAEDIAVFPVNDTYPSGHVAYVEEVYPNHSFKISECNFPWGVCVHTRTITDSDGIQFIHHRPDQPMKPKWIPPGLAQELELRETKEIEPLVPWQIKFKVKSSGNFQLRLDDKIVLEGNGSRETDWLGIDTKKHAAQFWVQRFQDGQFDYEWRFVPQVLGAESSPEPPKPITPTPTPTFPRPVIFSAPSLLSPGNGSRMPLGTDVTLSWNPSSSAIQYKVELWGAPYSLMTPCDWQSSTSCQIRSMWSGTRLWRVKARNGNGQESDWSDTWSFTIGQPSIITPTPTPTPTPTGICSQTPTNFHLSTQDKLQLPNGTVPNLVWQFTSDPCGGSIKYKVMIDNAATSNERQPEEQNHIESDWLTGTSWQPVGQGLEIGGRYTWYVIAQGNGGQTTSVDHWQFTIAYRIAPPPAPPPACDKDPNQPPAQFHLMSPVSNTQFGASSLPPLQWQATSDPNCDPIRYRVTIDNAAAPNERKPGEPDHITSDWLTTTSWTPVGKGLEKGGTYTWYVDADDNRGGSTGSIEKGWRFSIASQAPNQPAPTAVPANTAPPVPTNTPPPPPPKNTIPPTYTPTFTPIPTATLRPCPSGTGPGPTVYKAGDYDPNKLTQQEKNWLWKVFGHVGDTAPDGYGGERCK